MQRAFTNLLCDDPDATARFYQDLLGLSRTGDFGWFILLGHDALPEFELGILDQNHATVPPELKRGIGGALLTFVVPDVEAVHAKAQALGAAIIAPPTNTSYGQRRMLLSDPAGTVVDVSALI